MRWVHVLLLTIIVLLPAGKATAKVYRCQGASGSTVLTDQPKGKTGCVAIDTASGRCIVGSWGEGLIELQHGEYVRSYSHTNCFGQSNLPLVRLWCRKRRD